MKQRLQRLKSISATDELKGMAVGFIGVVLFGLTLPVTKLVLPSFDPLFVGTGRSMLAGTLAGALLWLTKSKRPSPNQFKKLFITGCGVGIGFPVLSAIAMGTVPASHGGAMLGILPLTTVVMSVILNKERPSLGFWLSSIVGGLLVVAFSLYGGAKGLQVGDLMLFVAIIGASVGYAIGGELAKSLGGWRVICWALVCVLPITSTLALILQPDSFSGIPVSAWAGFMYLALVSQLIGFFFWNKGLAMGGVARVSQVQLLQPFVTLIVSAYLVNEVIDSRTVVFTFLIILCVAIGKKMPTRRAAP